MKNYLFCLLCLMIGYISNGQELVRCGMTIQAHEQMMEDNEEYKNHHNAWRKGIKKILANSNSSKNPTCSNGPIKIPVAIHFDNGIVPSAEESCAIDVVVDQINEMNNEIAGLDSDASLINNFTSCFGAGILGDACVEFCIGQYNHPTGYGLVDGDYAVTFGQLSFSIPSGNYTPINSDWDEYINIYVDNLAGGLLGVSNGIPGLFNGDGVMVDNCVFGTGAISCTGVSFTGASGCFATYDEGETLAHELGHYLGLFHIWGDNSHCSGSQDMIADTPTMSNNYSGYLACGSHTSCANLPVTCGSDDMYMNFMSYAGDACMYMFTSDQADVMEATADLEGFTNVSSKCQGPPVADFIPDAPVSLCNTMCIDFTDMSTNNPTSWDWNFQVLNGNLVLDINDSSLQNPVVCITSGDQGDIEIELVATNALGFDTELKSFLVDEGCTFEDCDGDYLTINTITQDTSRAEFTLLSDALVNNGQSVLFTAGSYIDLDPGFEVISGTEFETLIEVCNSINVQTDPKDELFKIREFNLEEIEKLFLSEFEDKGTLSFELINQEGSIINSEEGNFETLRDFIEDSELVKGIYFLKLNSDKKSLVKRFLIRF